jgi:DNA-binding CsgD family transcriptional regulator
MVLRGRSEECRALDRLLDGARAGQSSALVIRGEAGVGKSVLLDYVAERASDCRVARIDGVESEIGFAFAGLLQLLSGPMLERIEHLAGPQRDALQRAFGLMDGPSPELFLVGLAALSLLSQVAEERPLVCLVDDVQWLDRESVSALSFVARRLAAEQIAILFALREPSPEQELDGLPELVLEGLGEADARLLLDTAVPGRLDEQVRERILAESRGNPLALLELPRGLTPAELAGGFGLPESREVASRVEQSFLRRVQALSPETQRLLVIAAAEATGDPAVVARAAGQLGINASAMVPAQDAGLIDTRRGVRFRHPLVRSAAYRAGTPEERRRVHEALAAAIDPQQDPDRRAWHRAHATAVPDENVAAELEHSAARAQARGGAAAAAAFLERAAELSPDPMLRGARALAAARLKHHAGAFEAAERLLTVATASPLEELDRARAQLLRAKIARVRTRGSDTPSLLSAAAQRLEPLDPELARETHLEALTAAVGNGRFARDRDVVEAAAAAAVALDSGREPARAIDLLLEATVARLTHRYEPPSPRSATALSAFRAEGFHRENLAWCMLACHVAFDLWEDDVAEAIATGAGLVARESGQLATLPLALNYSALFRLLRGEFSGVEQLLQEEETITAATRTAYIGTCSVLLAAWRGDQETTYKRRAAVIEAGTARGEAVLIQVAEWATAVLYNGLGEYTEATAAAERAYDLDVFGFSGFILPELIEAAARSGNRATAELAFARLAELSDTSATDWARGIEAATHALLSDGAQAEELHREAVDRLGRSRLVVLHARAQLSYGEWLRRANRRVDARTQLKTAYNTFDATGARAFAERARRELLATGETVRKRTMEARDELTPQEAQIARLASERLTNPEIAAQLYLSHRTVEYHLRKVFQKLGISSRKELADALRGSRSEPVPV